MCHSETFWPQPSAALNQSMLLPELHIQTWILRDFATWDHVVLGQDMLNTPPPSNALASDSIYGLPVGKSDTPNWNVLLLVVLKLHSFRGANMFG